LAGMRLMFLPIQDPHSERLWVDTANRCSWWLFTTGTSWPCCWSRFRVRADVRELRQQYDLAPGTPIACSHGPVLIVRSPSHPGRSAI